MAEEEAIRKNLRAIVRDLRPEEEERLIRLIMRLVTVYSDPGLAYKRGEMKNEVLEFVESYR